MAVSTEFGLLASLFLYKVANPDAIRMKQFLKITICVKCISIVLVNVFLNTIYSLIIYT